MNDVNKYNIIEEASELIRIYYSCINKDGLISPGDLQVLKTRLETIEKNSIGRNDYILVRSDDEFMQISTRIKVLCSRSKVQDTFSTETKRFSNPIRFGGVNSRSNPNTPDGTLAIDRDTNELFIKSNGEWIKLSY